MRDGRVPPSAAPEDCPYRDTFWWASARLNEEVAKLKHTLWQEAMELKWKLLRSPELMGCICTMLIIVVILALIFLTSNGG